MAACPSCSKELPGEFPFCPFCAAPLHDLSATSQREERKVVSVLFCDLVGFTAASEKADPEDVRARLQPYHQRLRQVIEGHGGTVEKFIGDAVMAVFGAPVAHEDDAERAVRAALRILEAIGELNQRDGRLDLQVRIGINTGEAVVAVGAHPERGEAFVTGDVVNTASRLQGAAPINGVAVTDQTHGLTQRVFIFKRLDPVVVKGKSAAIEAWQPTSARSRYGAEVVRTHAAPLVGREFERPLLIASFERAVKQRACQLVTVVGEPGVGKSRLCAELLEYIEQRPGLVRWRQGRCLPYGDGIAFWALGEIVKAECGILDSDRPEVAASKLDDAIAPDERDRAWFKARLAPLVGAESELASQEESFTAWRRFLESLAAENPLVLIFEDLHWADDAMLSFLEHLAEWSDGVPLLLLCTARPELNEKHPTWAARVRNAQKINLAPLSDEETATLFSRLLKRSVLPAATEQALLERAGGNPLYAEEFVRLLGDRDLIAGSLEEVPLPDSLQALIAARLDTLSAERKGLLQDASVVGKVFWGGALSAMGGREPREVALALHELARKELVRPARSSSMQGEQEYWFWHLLVRDVCYAQIPRNARAARHRAAAEWIALQAGDRADDLADVLAYHYLQAAELARVGGGDADLLELQSAARRFLGLAAERTLFMDVAGAEASFARALELAPPGHPERAGLLERWAYALQQQAHLKAARSALEEALAIYRAQGAEIAAGRVLTAVGVVGQLAGDPDARHITEESVAVLEGQKPGPELITACAELAGSHAIRSAYHAAVAEAEKAVKLADELRQPVPVRALGVLGYCRAVLGDAAGLADERRAVTIAIDQGRGGAAAALLNNLALATWQHAGPIAAEAVCAEGADFCERRGMTLWLWNISAMRRTFLAASGRADDALVGIEALISQLDAAGEGSIGLEARCVEMFVRGRRGEFLTEAANDLIASALGVGTPQTLAQAYPCAAEHLLAAGERGRVHELLVELTAMSDLADDPYYAAMLAGLVRSAIALRDPALAERLAAIVSPRTPLQRSALAACQAAIAEASNDQSSAARLYANAAAAWHALGDVPEEAYALLGQGRCASALRNSETTAPLMRARELFATMGYAPAVSAADALMGDAHLAR